MLRPLRYGPMLPLPRVRPLCSLFPLDFRTTFLCVFLIYPMFGTCISFTYSRKASVGLYFGKCYKPAHLPWAYNISVPFRLGYSSIGGYYLNSVVLSNTCGS